MKFENDLIRIEIEKKKLTAQQKEARRAKWKKRRPYVIAAGALAAAILGGIGYSRFHGQPEPDGDYVTAVHLAESAKEKYKDTTLYGYAYGDTIEELGRDEAIRLHMDFDPYEVEGAENWGYFYEIFQSPDLSGEITGSSYDWDEATETLTIAPPNYAPGCIATMGLNAETVNRYEHSQYALFDRGSGYSWGNLGTLYLARYCDDKTGERLEEPVVSIITLQAEIADTPSLDYSILEDGRPEFWWTPSEGAAEYIVCEAEYSPESGYAHFIYPLGTTTQTSWTTEAVAFDRYATANRDFDTYRISEDQWKDESTHEYYKDEYEPGTVVKADWALEGDKALCVIAVNAEGTSMMSNAVLFSELAPNLPSAVAVHAEEENGFGAAYESVEKFPAYDYVTMCDGITNQKLIDYHTEEASVTPKRIGYMDEAGNYVKGETRNYLTVPYVVEGTPFSYTMELSDYDEANLQEDMRFLEERESQLRRKAGSRAFAAMQNKQSEETLQPEQKVRQTEDIAIFADSALGEYLAASMLAGAGVIDLSAFPEAKDTSVVEDIFMEAYYQNPMILGVSGYQIDRRKMLAYVTYDDDSAVQVRKQREIQEKIEKIIGQIATTGMTDREIEIAINQYLCDSITYDEDALINAQENGFAYVDAEFKDSFTAYGALVNGRCVCSGYAAAFKLLSEAAGLESIVVTGILDGGLSHEWNKVKVDGNWHIVDATNNDMDHIPNALLNIPDFAGERILVEDKAYMTDRHIARYRSDDESCEYYHVMKRFFPVGEAAGQLAGDLQADGEAVLRTDYDLNDERFYGITDDVYEIMGDDTDLYGFYWLGVIYLSTERF